MSLFKKIRTFLQEPRLIGVNPDSEDLHHLLQTSDKPLNTLKKSDLCPGSKALEEINAGLR